MPPPRSRPLYDYATMTVEQAQQLAGRTIRVRANITDPNPEGAGAGEADDVQRRVIRRRGDETADEGELVVEGRLAIRYIPSYVIEGEFVEGFYRLRLEADRPIRDPAGDD